MEKRTSRENEQKIFNDLAMARKMSNKNGIKATVTPHCYVEAGVVLLRGTSLQAVQTQTWR